MDKLPKRRGRKVPSLTWERLCRLLRLCLILPLLGGSCGLGGLRNAEDELVNELANDFD